MYQDARLWKRVREQILVDGKSIRYVSATTRISRATIRKMLDNELPPLPNKGTKPKDAAKVVTEASTAKPKGKQEWMGVVV